MNGQPLKSSDLIKLVFAKNEADEYVDPVTYKVFTDNTHIVSLRHGGSANVFAWETVERLNIKAKMWRDLVSDEEFTRKDIITLQDPQNLESRDLSSFEYLKEGNEGPMKKDEEESGINVAAMGSSAKIIKAKEAVAKARAERAQQSAAVASAKSAASGKNGTLARASPIVPAHTSKSAAYNASHHTSGWAAASFTSTGLTPDTSGALALLTDEEYLLRPKRVKEPGYARLLTTQGPLNIELYPEHAPRAVWNFINLCKRGFYDGVTFHRNIRNFMIQGGDPTGTGRGGTSCWGKNFNDEFDGPLKHDTRGMVSMANKGKNTNSSQFFIIYRAATHLDRKHTIFGKVVGGEETLKRLEDVPVNKDDNRPKEEIKITEAAIFVDPFEEFMKRKKESEAKEEVKKEIIRQGGAEDEKVTWTGKRVRADGTVERGDGGGGGVGKYLKSAIADEENGGQEDEIVDFVDEDIGVEEPIKKKSKAGGGFGNFDSW